MTSPDLKKLLHRVTGFVSQSEPPREESSHRRISESESIVNRASIKIDLNQETRSTSAYTQEAIEVPQPSSPGAVAEPLIASQPTAEIQRPGDSAKNDREALVSEDLEQSYFSLHIGSFRNLQNASAEAERLNANGLNCFWKKASIPGKGEWYRVYLGKHKTRDEALHIGEELKAKGVIQDFFVHELKAG